MIRVGLRAAVVASVIALVMSPSAWALSQPVVDADATPPSGGVGPVTPMVQRTECATTGVVPGTDPGVPSPNQRMLNLEGAWSFSRGEGQTVAIIDTGVTPGPRLPNVEPGGDFVADTDGLTDCDGHGTLVAGIVGGQPGPDAFSGVAPAARLLSIRQTSAAYSRREHSDDPGAARATIDIATLARAVVHAADSGARVINISVVTCLRAGTDVDQQALGAALRYAAVDKDAVIVAAAGDVGLTTLSGSTECQANPIGASVSPDDPRNWGEATSASIPSWWQPYVLSVGSVTPVGEPSAFSMPGPWLGIAAPGEDIVSVGNSPAAGLVNGLSGARDQWVTLAGTGYAAAYVSGVAALVRSRFPELSAAQVIHRLQATAHTGTRTPSNLVGAGALDPVAALTWELSASGLDPAGSGVARIAAPATAPTRDHSARNIAFAGTAVLALAVIGAAWVTQRRKDHGR
ncbi:type VII secretion-associated serine protease mycosin [Mycobacterium sp. CVI_P3]|uniref:Type VII secretion-associated serine protease mycosin n=1 Tax=Mycobacterium pinniadriaticum TaxID=2994102 RepID=A0ABT3SKX7_9MYCO|nr:type VII secretion-associated serine protease mycosin [Mycobacterium pinniadriaticum]MCX2933416.1 type VII secretion-associated serine protease mycosin [Mycobacterium pinniadriaticum]MCX2939838.1 type VII secretion-associated serine protease mycosin [Mycobacterium pinniadriaticum]